MVNRLESDWIVGTGCGNFFFFFFFFSFSINNSNFQIFSKKYFLHFNSFVNTMGNGTFAPQEQIFHFS